VLIDQWQDLCLASMVALDPLIDREAAQKIVSAAAKVGFRSRDPEQAARELLQHPTIRPGRSQA
jgi:hypothetical protein